MIIPSYLVPAAICSSRPTLKRANCHVIQQHATNATRDSLINHPIIDQAQRGYDVPIKARKSISGARQRDSSAWVEIIESYLPIELRTENKGTLEHGLTHKSPFSISSLPVVLSKARASSNVDLLSYLGVHQGRWEAVVWLVKAMMEQCPSQSRHRAKSRQLIPQLWPAAGQSLDQVTNQAIQGQIPQQSKISLDRFTEYNNIDCNEGTLPRENHGLGQIWQSLGVMILQATDLSTNDSSYSIIMFRVLEILAHLHHINAFPDSIYNYTPATDPTVLRRPPTLYLFSKRIMSTLSDIAWGLEWEKEASKASSQGYELPKASFQPKVRELGPELWLDLILWACVEGGWIKEGAWIVSEMEKCKGNPDMRWSVISWREICENKSPALDWTSILRYESNKTQINQVGGLGIASGTSSAVSIGARTISREVVLAIIDGSVNMAQESGHNPSNHIIDAQKNIDICKDLLNRAPLKVDTNFLNANMLRMIESAGFETRDMPGALQRIIDIRPTHVGHSKGCASESVLVQDHSTDDSAAILGLLHRNLYNYASLGNLQGSLTTFKKIQSLVDTNRTQSIKTFADKLRSKFYQGFDDEDMDVVGSDQSDRLPILHHQIPVHALAAFLDLLTTSKYFDLGRWLLLSDDIDGGAFGPDIFSERNLQPALLRFATATVDDKLLNNVVEKLEMPLSEPILHALLRCETSLNKWNIVEDLLRHFQKTPGMSWKASDAMAIARAILQMEYDRSADGYEETTLHPFAILQDIVNGKFNSKRNYSRQVDLSEIKLANQLGRILKTLPGRLKHIFTETRGNIDRAHASVDVTPNAFNLILEPLVECYGSMAGKKLWERWCRDPKGPKTHINSPAFDPISGLERVVTPTLYMLRNILRPVVHLKPESSATTTGDCEGDGIPPSENQNEARVKRESCDTPSASDTKSEEESIILRWGVAMFEKFGLSKSQIKKEISWSQLKKSLPYKFAKQ